jgi:flavin reductase (DIM6/NTAB) family NADH-FMN oxidoreductase RutF
MFYATSERGRTKLPHDPFKAIVAPRPIGWIWTRALDGSVNLAPYSFLDGFASFPPIVGFSSEGWKDSASFGTANTHCEQSRSGIVPSANSDVSLIARPLRRQLVTAQ